ncbi:MAG: FAD-dependent oxidoreductase, partial [Nitrososphaerales archaeon]
FPKSDPSKRSHDFSEVQQPYTLEEVTDEAKRCLLCGTPVCIDACPVQMDVRGMCEAVSRGDLGTAFSRIRDTNALIGVTARCCPQLQGLCEDACVMRWDGDPVSIGMIQRFVADWEQYDSRQSFSETSEADSGKRVAIVGGGPSGLAAAALLRRYGHSVTIYEQSNELGGTARYGIPDYHLPKDVLSYEIQRIKELGVETRTGIMVGRDISLSQIFSERADAVLITTGPKDPVKLDTPGIDSQGVYDCYAFLEAVYGQGVENYLKNPTYQLGSTVLVIGGGDSALDGARTARRLTAGKVTIVYRRTENEMPSDPIMVEEAREEGIEFMFLADPAEYLAVNGKLDQVRMNTMELGPPDQTGRRSPQIVSGKDFVLECNSVLLAVGRGPNSFLQEKEGLKTGKKNSIAVDDHFKTSMDRVFAAGDVVNGETLVVKAMGSGREAAQRVHEYLTNLEQEHVSLYERYFVQRSFELMQADREGGLPPP